MSETHVHHILLYFWECRSSSLENFFFLMINFDCCQSLSSPIGNANMTFPLLQRLLQFSFGTKNHGRRLNCTNTVTSQTYWIQNLSRHNCSRKIPGTLLNRRPADRPHLQNVWRARIQYSSSGIPRRVQNRRAPDWVHRRRWHYTAASGASFPDFSFVISIEDNCTISGTKASAIYFSDQLLSSGKSFRNM